jgi:hypothetical protein
LRRSVPAAACAVLAAHGRAAMSPRATTTARASETGSPSVLLPIGATVSVTR